MEINKTYKVAILLNGREVVFNEGFENEECKQRPAWKNPMYISIVPTKEGRGQVVIVPTCTFGSNDYIKPVGAEALVTVYDLDAKLNAAYEESVKKLSAQKSGIEIVPANVIPKMKDVTKHPALQNIRRNRKR